MSIGEGAAVAGVGLGLLVNLAVGIFHYGRMSEKVGALGSRLSGVSSKVDRLTRQVARVEGRLGIAGGNDRDDDGGSDG